MLTIQISELNVDNITYHLNLKAMKNVYFVTVWSDLDCQAELKKETTFDGFPIYEQKYEVVLQLFIQINS